MSGVIGLIIGIVLGAIVGILITTVFFLGAEEEAYQNGFEDGKWHER